MSFAKAMAVAVAFAIAIAGLVTVHDNRFKVNLEPYDPMILYPSTEPVDMLGMRKILVQRGYRFQNPLRPVSGQTIADQRYPEVYRQRTGFFKKIHDK